MLATALLELGLLDVDLAFEVEALDDGFLAVEADLPLDFAALVELLAVVFFLFEETWRARRTGRFQSTALSARNDRGMASMPSA